MNLPYVFFNCTTLMFNILIIINILQVNSETIDATAPDVFTPELDKSWKPDQIIQHAEDVIEHLTAT